MFEMSLNEVASFFGLRHFILSKNRVTKSGQDSRRCSLGRTEGLSDEHEIAIRQGLRGVP